MRIFELPLHGASKSTTISYLEHWYGILELIPSSLTLLTHSIQAFSIARSVLVSKEVDFGLGKGVISSANVVGFETVSTPWLTAPQ